MRYLGQRREVDDVAERVADRFAEQRPGPAVDQLREGVRIAAVGKAHLDAVLRQRVREQVVGAAIERPCRHDVVAGLGQRLDGAGDGGHARCQRQAGHAALERRDALLEHVLRRVHDARVDVARHLEIEQVGTVLGVVERVRSGLVDRHGHGLGGGLGAVAAVDGDGFEFHGCTVPVVKGLSRGYDILPAAGAVVPEILLRYHLSQR